MRNQPMRGMTIDTNAVFQNAARNAAKSAAHYHTANRARAAYAPTAYVTYNPNPLITALAKLARLMR
jgi:hypothetical protein